MPTPGVLSVAIAAARRGSTGVVVPAANAREAAQVEGLRVVAASTARRGRRVPAAAPGHRPTHARPTVARGAADRVDFADVRGQHQARRALEVAAAGGHNAAAGRLARRGQDHAGPPASPRSCPSSPATEALETTQLHSVAGLLAGGEASCARGRSGRRTIPSRRPGLLGGGTTYLRPGEVSLAHHGVLFLDEFTEFRRDAVEGLRQPLEDGRVVVTRAVGSVEFPARFTLVAAANPCPCGFEGDPRRHCRCRSDRARAVPAEAVRSVARSHRPAPARAAPHQGRAHGGDAGRAVRRSSAIGCRRARDRQRERWDLARRRVQRAPAGAGRAPPGAHACRGARPCSGAPSTRLGLTGRGFDRALKVARTIADLEGAGSVDAGHMAEALSYRDGVRAERGWPMPRDAVRMIAVDRPVPAGFPPGFAAGCRSA